MKRHKIGYKFTDKSQSKRGICSFVLTVLSNSYLYCSDRTILSEQRKWYDVFGKCGRLFDAARTGRIYSGSEESGGGKFLQVFPLHCNGAFFSGAWYLGGTLRCRIFTVTDRRCALRTFY